jgi:acetylornithine deacetylase
MDDLSQLVSDMVAIDSTNPDLVPGAAGESKLAHYIAEWLTAKGVKVQLIESAPGRPNVVGTVRGTGGGKTLLLNGHIDTVGAGKMQAAHQPVVREGRLYGRGAYDMKGGLAACMAAAASAVNQQLRGDLIITAVVDEEYAGQGTLDLAHAFPADGAIVAEFTELRIITAHKGFVWLDVETRGVAAHGSRPDLGVDAIAKMGRVLTEIDKLDQQLRQGQGHSMLGTGSIHASIIRGGTELSTYPDQCVVSVERRTVPGETPEQAEAEVARIVEALGREDPSLKATVTRAMDRPPMETPADAEILAAVSTAASKVLQHKAQIAGVPFWTDAAALAAAGTPSLLFGPSGAGAHAAEEWVDLASVQACADVYFQAAIQFCG